MPRKKAEQKIEIKVRDVVKKPYIASGDLKWVLKPWIWVVIVVLIIIIIGGKGKFSSYYKGGKKKVR